MPEAKCEVYALCMHTSTDLAVYRMQGERCFQSQLPHRVSSPPRCAGTVGVHVQPSSCRATACYIVVPTPIDMSNVLVACPSRYLLLCAPLSVCSDLGRSVRLCMLSTSIPIAIKISCFTTW